MRLHEIIEKAPNRAYRRPNWEQGQFVEFNSHGQLQGDNGEFPVFEQDDLVCNDWEIALTITVTRASLWSAWEKMYLAYDRANFEQLCLELGL